MAMYIWLCVGFIFGMTFVGLLIVLEEKAKTKKASEMFMFRAEMQKVAEETWVNKVATFVKLVRDMDRRIDELTRKKK